jgi:coenzyme PQQ precursor peptide PqqA
VPSVLSFEGTLRSSAVVGRPARLEEKPGMKQRWEKPSFEYVPLGAEVTAYLGTSNPN